jgi:cellulose synthase/poly-beta-1,6-N-acetylglucosamine synthase-like glycosyltransferase
MNFPLFNYDLFSNSEFYLFFYGIVFLDLPRYGFSILINALLVRYVAPLNKSFMPKITVVVASHNGAGSITQAIQSILNQSCPIHEIIVVDDCSSDETAEIIESAYKLKLIKIALFHSRRCGKSASVNHAARFATGDFILNIDDDTVLNYDAVENLVSVFVDENTVIASGALTIRNSEVSLVTSLQTIEYQLSIVGGRSFLDLFGAMPSCSGPSGTDRAMY